RARATRLGLGLPGPEGPAQPARAQGAWSLFADLLRRPGPRPRARQAPGEGALALPRDPPVDAARRRRGREAEAGLGRSVEVEDPGHVPEAGRVRPERPDGAGRGRDVTLPVAEPRHVPPRRGAERPSVARGAPTRAAAWR